MKTSWNEIRQADDFLQGCMPPQERLIIEAKLILNPAFRASVHLQKQFHSLIKKYGRKKLKAETEFIHQKLFTDPDRKIFQDEIHQLFKNT